MSSKARLLFIIILIQAVLAMLGSLYFSNVLLYAPCDLCWYQRIGMYPLGFIAAVALIRKDVSAVWYALPLSIAGLLVSVFHVTIYTLANYTNKEVGIQCSVDGVSCTTRYLDLWGIISIPHLSLLAFMVTTICLFMLMKETKKS